MNKPECLALVVCWLNALQMISLPWPFFHSFRTRAFIFERRRIRPILKVSRLRSLGVVEKKEAAKLPVDEGLEERRDVTEVTESLLERRLKFMLARVALVDVKMFIRCWICLGLVRACPRT